MQILGGYFNFEAKTSKKPKKNKKQNLLGFFQKFGFLELKSPQNRAVQNSLISEFRENEQMRGKIYAILLINKAFRGFWYEY